MSPDPIGVCIDDIAPLAGYPCQLRLGEAIVLHYELSESVLKGRLVCTSCTDGGFIALGATAALLLEWSPRRNRWRRLFAHPATLGAGLGLFFHTLLIDSGDYGGQVRGVGIALGIGWIYLNQASLPAAFLDLPPLRYLGRISYGIYMWQGFFLATGPGRLEGQTWPPETWTGFALLAVIAPLSYHVFEKPILRFKNRFRPGLRRRTERGQSQQATTF